MSTVINTDATLGELVIADPRRSQIFAELGLDFCCNGNRSLAVASADAGLEIHDVVAAIDLPDVSLPRTETSRSQSRLAHDIVDTHHAYMWQEMPRLGLQVAKVLAVHGDSHPELAELNRLYAQMVEALDPHMTTEERIVFPAIRRLEKGEATVTVDLAGSETSLESSIQDLRDEHAEVGDLLQRIREITDDFSVPADACTTYTLMLGGLEKMDLDLREHIHKENNILFPQVLALEQDSRR